MPYKPFAKRSLEDSHKDSFREAEDDRLTRQAVEIETGNGSILAGITWDYVEAAYPNTTTETFTFKNGGSGGDTVATVTIIYTDSTKEDISTVEKT